MNTQFSSKPRAGITCRDFLTMTYQSVDRVPDVEFAFWAQTIRRWLAEGLPLDLTEEEQNQENPRKLLDYFGFDQVHTVSADLKMGMNPAFEEKIIEDLGDAVLKQGADGQVAECYLQDSQNSSIPHYISFPVANADDWAAMKERFRHDDPLRRIMSEDLQETRKGIAQGKAVSIDMMGPYGRLREWMGFENLSIAFYEQPDMIHEMVEHWTDLGIQQIRALPEDIPIDRIGWWEDMACKNGPLVSPTMFREFLQPCYHRVMAEARKHGCTLGAVDSDGNPHDIVANWLEEGVNVMYPLEVAAGVDIRGWRREFGRQLRLKGGIAKYPLTLGGMAIDDELERIKPIMDQGGYIPHLDHFVPPDVSFDNFRYYLDKKRKLIGK